MTETQTKIIQSAETCFFQYGYSKTNMSLVSEYAGTSRVTVHKYYKNKIALFRGVIEECMSASMEEAKALLISSPSDDCWFNVERYMLAKTKSVFDNVTDGFILKDLHNAANEIALDLLEEKNAQSAAFIANEIRKSEKLGLIDLSRTSLTADEIGELIIHSFSGLFMYAEIKNMREQIKNLIKVFHAGTIKV